MLIFYRRSDRRKINWEVILGLVLIVLSFILLGYNVARYATRKPRSVATACPSGYQGVLTSYRTLCILNDSTMARKARDVSLTTTR